MNVDYLRLSITDRCNLRCTYCMPAEGVPPRSHEEILSYEELAIVTRVAAECGITKVRITGGEPLVRRGCAGFVGMLARTSGIGDVALTTNGVLLPEHAEELRHQGLRRVNISIDSLDAERFAAVTRGGRLDDVMAGLDSAIAAGFSPIKINVLLLEGIEDDLAAFVDLARERAVHVRFIEFMPLDRRLTGGAEQRLVPAPLILQRLRDAYGLEPWDGPYGHGPAVYWRGRGMRGSLGFVAGVSSHFCASCNRLRLTSDGRLRTCLFSNDEIDIRPYIPDPRRLRQVFREALAHKRYDRTCEGSVGGRAMSEIGG